MSGAFVKAKFLNRSYVNQRCKADRIPNNVIRFALSQNPFFYFDNLSHYFPNIGSFQILSTAQDY
jgi:type III restriction enzyme